MPFQSVLFIIADGVDAEAVTTLREGFIRYGVAVTTAAARPCQLVESVRENRRGDDITVDLSLDSVAAEQFGAVILPGGLLATGYLAQEAQVVQFLLTAAALGLTIISVRDAAGILSQAHLLAPNVAIWTDTSPVAIERQLRMLSLAESPVRSAELPEEGEEWEGADPSLPAGAWRYPQPSLPPFA